ncbi:MAG: dihydrolipoyllysine-residue acetyltransferase, partial [Proteobacteria bacterium]|nr:dihydrolipoyllysine-residue acetyltransferase [Pseudomonadota bacterium]
VQIPAIANGRVEKLYYKKGAIAKVHSPLFSVDESPHIPTDTKEKKNQIVESKPIKEKFSEQQISNNQSHQKVLATPAIRRKARQWGIDLDSVMGSGKSGRILEQDLQQLRTVPKKTPTDTQAQSESITGIRRQMARQMSLSSSTIPHFTYNDEIDITELVSLKKKLKKEVENNGFKITYLSFFIKALSLAIKDFPILNASINDDVTEILYHQQINIGVAVDTPNGLIVPNIKNADQLSILKISEEISRLTESAKSGEIAASDLKEGTITVSNIGAIGGGHSTPLISPPEVAIVALGKIQLLPRYIESSEPVPRNIIFISWSGDHRIIDGATMARFCNLWKGYLETPSLMLVHL